jgi:hypothetical protein
MAALLLGGLPNTICGAESSASSDSSGASSPLTGFRDAWRIAFPHIALFAMHIGREIETDRRDPSFSLSHLPTTGDSTRTGRRPDG